jgi:integral membrane sensor domain MASE1
VQGFAAAVWPPAGIALVALVLYGARLWPSIAVSAFVVNWWAGAPMGTGSVCCRSIRDLHLSSFLYQEYLLEGEALLQHS